MWILKIPWGKMGPGKLGPVSASVNTYILASSRTPNRFASFPDLCNMEDCDTLGQWTAFFPSFSHFWNFVTFKLENLLAC